MIYETISNVELCKVSICEVKLACFILSSDILVYDYELLDIRTRLVTNLVLRADEVLSQKSFIIITA